MTSLASPAQPASSLDKVFSIGRFALVLALLIFAMFPQVVTGLHTFMFRDYSLFGYPFAHYNRECFWRGEIPLWNPYNNFGIPHLAQWTTMVLYPPALIYLLLPLPWSLGIFCLIHLWFGGLGMYVLASQWSGSRFAGAVAGISFAFAGMTLNCLMWPHVTAGLAWMPWVVWAVSRGWQEGKRTIFIGAIFGGLQMLTGMPEVILFTWLILAGLWMCGPFESWSQVWIAARRFVAMVVLVAALAAAQLFPFLELLRHSDRDSSFATDPWSVPLWGWANLFVPLFRLFGSKCGVHFQTEQLFTTSYYTGLFILAMAAYALFTERSRRVWYLSGVSLIGLVLCFGDSGFLYKWLRTAIPQLGFMRYPSKIVIVFTFAWPILAAFGLRAFLERTEPENRRRQNRQLAFIVGVVALFVAGIVVFARLVPFPGEVWSRTFSNGSVRLALFVISAAGLVWLGNRQVPHAGLFWVLPLLVWVDLATHVPQQNPTVDREALTIKVPVLEELSPRPRLGESRALPSIRVTDVLQRPVTSNMTQVLLCHRNGLFANLNLLEGIAKADGFYSMNLNRHLDVHLRLYATDDQPRPALARFTGISQVTAGTNLMRWEPCRDFLPLVTAGQQPVFANQSRTLSGLIDPNFDPAATVYLPTSARDQISVTNRSTVSIRRIRVGTQRLEADVSATEPALVVVAQTYYKAWQAKIDGRSAKIWPANHAFQAVEVGPGDHRVELVYHDRPFLAGVGVSILAWIGCLAGLLTSKFRTANALIQDTNLCK